ncbi:MAG: hypothetical protein D6758_14040 [Gammaproteobacteria bacterium]|nr:MAG: hypothetical protein D6758_14040 [Gammaproteobacteria bacterium]
MKRHRRLKHLRDALLKRGIHARSCFQTFLTGGILSVCALATLLLTPEPGPIALMLLWGMIGMGVCMAVPGYLGLLVFRLSDFLAGDTPDDSN